mmetsp:Transcript_28608/g.66277  ORF Transcript_28608/g.66277 Transcript_28608/m.66277 type:complete len:573 (+) Transcript_28608:87-1805(+)
MATTLAVKRVQKELKAFHERPSLQRVHVRCDEWNMLKMWYVFQGPAATPYDAGWYWGTLVFPESYPLAPPSVQVLTPSGRFQTRTNICLSISSFHPENWSPGVGFAAVLEGLINFMGEDGKTVGSLENVPPVDERRRLAEESLQWNRQQPEFQDAFPDIDELLLPGPRPEGSMLPQSVCLEEPAEDEQQQEPQPEVEKRKQAAKASQVPAQFTCSLCQKVYLDPVTTPCGHTFCQRCLSAALAASSPKSVCPSCGVTVVAGQSVNILLRSLLEQQCGDAIQQRRSEEAAAATAEGAVQAGSQRVILPDALACPILPVLMSAAEVLLPCEKRIWRPRSQEEHETIEYAIKGARKLAVAAGPLLLRAVCCIAELESVTRTPQGSIRECLLVGRGRVWLAATPESNENGVVLCRCATYQDEELAQVELTRPPTPDAPRDDPLNSPAISIAELAVEKLQDHLRSAGPSGMHAFRKQFGTIPAVTESSEDLERLSVWLASAVMATEEQRREFLDCSDTRSRLLACLTILLAPPGRMVLNLPGAGSWMNVGNSAMANIFLLLLPIVLLILARVLGIRT